MKKGSSGRALTVVLIVLIMFFSYLHQFYTLDPDNNNSPVKHIFSLIPLSAYQMVIMTAEKQCRNSLRPLGWTNNDPSLTYPVSYALGWLLGDCFLYFLLFCFFNLTISRDFGTPPLGFREFFSSTGWKRLFSPSSRSQVSNESKKFIDVEHLSKSYDGDKRIEALKDVSFHVDVGEVIVLIGPNGAGKSTFIKSLAGAIEISKGSVSILGGKSTGRFQELLPYLGVCFQENVIVNLLSIREHFHLFASFRGVLEDDLEEAIEYFGHQLQLTEMLDNRAKDLSGGQKRKLCIALSLLGNPPLVIMDEPTAGVDVQARKLIWKMISSLENTTTIVSSHALEEAEAVSSRLFIISAGEIAFCGTSTELREQNKCGYVMRINTVNNDLEPFMEFAKGYVKDISISDERDDTVLFPIDSGIPEMLTELENRKDELGIISYSFSVQQLEDMLLKLIQSQEAQHQG
jgi:ABC-type multidrug transport system ATPase subunit